jgi:hypothetical protein
MTRKYAAVRLLEHGPLTHGEFVTVTGWTQAQASTTLNGLKAEGALVTTLDIGCRKSIYSLAQ